MKKVKNIAFIMGFMLLLSCELTGCGADGMDGISVEQTAFPDAVTERPARESEADSAEQEPMQDTQEDLGGSETEPETKQESETSGAPTEEINNLYDFGPVSYDLSTLPAMENKLYAEWEGNIYFRQYSDEDIEKGALWANFADIPDTEKELMCLTPDGELAQVGSDYGCGTIYIVNGRLYSQRYTNRKNGEDNDSYDSVVYSCELDGTDVIEYSSYEVLALKGDWIICETRNAGMEGLAVINVQTGQERILVDSQKQYSFLDYLGATEEEIFYYIHPGVHGDFDRGNSGADEDLVLYSVDYDGNIRELTTVTCEEYLECGSEVGGGFPMDASLHIHCFKILGDDIYFNVGSDNGSGQMYSGGPIFSMKKDGSERKVQELSYDTQFYLYDDGVNRVLLCSTIYKATGKVAENGRMVPISLTGQAPQDIVLRTANGYSYDEPYVYSSKNSADSVLLYPDTSGICYVLLTEQDCENLSIDTVVDGHVCQDIKDVEYLDGKLFFTVTDLTYSIENSIGWRDGYVRGKTICYCKDIESGEISLLYEY